MDWDGVVCGMNVTGWKGRKRVGVRISARFGKAYGLFCGMASLQGRLSRMVLIVRCHNGIEGVREIDGSVGV